MPQRRQASPGGWAAQSKQHGQASPRQQPQAPPELSSRHTGASGGSQSGTGRDPGGTRRRIGWFAALWIASLAFWGLLIYGIRWLIGAGD